MVGVEEGELPAVGGARRLGDPSDVLDEHVLTLGVAHRPLRRQDVAQRTDQIGSRNVGHRALVEVDRLRRAALRGAHTGQPREGEVVPGKRVERLRVGVGRVRHLAAREVLVPEMHERPGKRLRVGRARRREGERQHLDRPGPVAVQCPQEGGPGVCGQPGTEVEHALHDPPGQITAVFVPIPARAGLAAGRVDPLVRRVGVEIAAD